MPSIYKRVFGLLLQRKKISVSRKFVSKLNRRCVSESHATSKSVYRNVLYSLTASKKKNLHFFWKNSKTKWLLSSKFFRKSLLWNPFEKSKYLSTANSFPKFNRRVARKNVDGSLYVDNLEKILKGTEISKVFGESIKHYRTATELKLLGSRRTLSSCKPKLKFKEVIKLKGRPWWFNREKKIHLKFFSWKKTLVGKTTAGEPTLFLGNKTSILPFFNWILKKKNDNFGDVLFFKRLVFSYRMVQAYSNFGSQKYRGLENNTTLFAKKALNNFWWPLHKCGNGF